MGSHNIKESTVRGMVTVGCKGKRKSNLSPTALTLLTQLSNVFMNETLRRSAQSAIERNSTVIREEDLQRVIAQLFLDFT